MSYDIGLIIDTGGPDPAWLTSRNQTSNVSCMWRAAGVELADFEGQTARDVLPALRAVIAAMEADPATYKAMNPSNGWGDYDSCLKFLRDLVKDFASHPKATVTVSR